MAPRIFTGIAVAVAATNVEVRPLAIAPPQTAARRLSNNFLRWRRLPRLSIALLDTPTSFSSSSFPASSAKPPRVRGSIQRIRRRRLSNGSQSLNSMAFASSFYSATVAALAAGNSDPASSSLPTAAGGAGGGGITGRAAEVASVAILDVALPILFSAARFVMDHSSSSSSSSSLTWDEFWSSPSDGAFGEGTETTAETTATVKTSVSNAARVATALERLGPTYVKFGQALASRPDVVPPSLAAALSKLQDRMEPFDTNEARSIIESELLPPTPTLPLKTGEEGGGEIPTASDGIGTDKKGTLRDDDCVRSLLDSLSPEPVAAASIGQVYRGVLPGYGDVAVKVQRPGVRVDVERDFALLRRAAEVVESLPSVPVLQDSDAQSRLVSTELVSAVDEFMSRIFEELDYRREADNAARFGELYSDRGGIAVGTFPGGVGVMVPEILPGLCTENVLVMEWIDGTKLTDVRASASASASASGGKEVPHSDEEKEENLALLELAIKCTLSQLLDTGIMHADPHGGNLLKVLNQDDKSEGQRRRRGDGGRPSRSYRLAYLDFGLLSTVPAQVRDGLVCAVAVLIFARDVDAVAGLFGELQLLPEEVLSDPAERAALSEALEVTLSEALTFPDEEAADGSGRNGGRGAEEDGSSSGERSAVPVLKFDKLLDALARLVPRFRFELPPYFINNARALSTLEGIARSLDPDFNVLRVMYPYALNRMLRNPTGSPVVDRTVMGLIRADGGEGGGRHIDRSKVAKLLRDSAAITGYRKRRVLWDILRTRGGQRFVMKVAAEGLHHRVLRGRFKSSRRSANERKRRKRGLLSGDYMKL